MNTETRHKKSKNRCVCARTSLKIMETSWKIFIIYPYNTVTPEIVYRLRLFRPYLDLFVLIVNYAVHKIGKYLVHFQRQKHNMRCPFISRKFYLKQDHIIPLLK